MDYNSIRKMAKNLNIKCHHMKKADLIRAIQRMENNPECFATKRLANCNEPECLWRSDCEKENLKTRPEE